MHTTKPGDNDAHHAAPRPPETAEFKTAYETVMQRYPGVYWATDRHERTITAYTVRDSDGADPLVTVCIDETDMWIACVHAEPNPMTGKVYRLKDGKQTEAAPKTAILALLDVYFSEMLATMLTRTPEWIGSLTRETAAEIEAWDTVTDGPLDRHRKTIGKLTMH